VAFGLYVLSALVILAALVRAWPSRLPLELRFSALLLASVLVAPHLTVYDLVILAPAFLLLGNWATGQDSGRAAQAVPALLYLSYPLFFARADRSSHASAALRRGARGIVLDYRDDRIRFPYSFPRRYTEHAMTTPAQPNIKLVNGPDYRDSYANSVQVRVSVWDFFLVFGTLQQQSETQVEVRNFQGVYLSPQQAKALLAILQQDITNYENAFGEIKLDPRMTSPGQVH
jgi:hypothetical protein